MADSSVAVTPGVGANVDTRTTTGGDHRQVVVPGGETDAEVAKFTNAAPGASDYGLVVRPIASASSTALYDGSVTGITTTPAAMPTQACVEVLVTADPANTANLLIGNASSQSTPLQAGQSVVVPVANVNLIYRKSASGTQAASYLARN